MTVVLIGGGGFIGRHVAAACLASGLTVRIADVHNGKRAPVPADGLPEGVEICVGDYREPTFVADVVKGAHAVVHLAHDAMHLNGRCDMAEEYERNILPAIRLMEACLDAAVQRFVFVSSGGTVYGNQPAGTPILESAHTQPISLYGTAKLSIEHIAQLYFIQRQLPAIVVRPANAYGAGQLPFRGQGLIPTAFASAQHRKKVSIFGDGGAVRDYVHVTDIARGIVAAIQAGHLGNAYNIGSASGVSTRRILTDYVIPLVENDQLSLDVAYLEERKADVQYNVLDYSKLHDHTGFAPTVSLDQGMRDVWAWLKLQFKLD